MRSTMLSTNHLELLRIAAIAAQNGAMVSRDMSQLKTQADPSALRRARRTGAVFLFAWLAAAGYLCYYLALAWPYMMSPAHIGLMLVCPGILFQAVNHFFLWQRRELLRGRLHYGVRGIAIVGGIFFASFLVAPLESLSMARFERGLAPFLGQIKSQLTAPCPPQAKYVSDATMRAYFVQVGAPIRRVALHHDAKRFVLAVQGRSIDIDGSTIYYDSNTTKWTKYHNDNRIAADVLEALHKGFEQCQFSLPE